MNLRKVLNKPIPVLPNLKTKFLVAVLFGFFVYFFVLVFEPYNTSKIIKENHLYILGFPIITIIVVFLFLQSKNYIVEKWTLKRQVLFVLEIFIVIALINFTYNSLIGTQIAAQHSFLKFIEISFTIGTLPTVLLVFIIIAFFDTNKQFKIQESKIDLGNKLAQKKINITSNDIKLDDFSILSKNLLFVKSEDNYCNIVYLDDEAKKSKLLRLTLKEVSEQLMDYESIVRCHRSYIVNKFNICRVTGNSKSMKVYMNNISEPLPVSRSYYKQFTENFID
jgi:hypothetical protein